MTQFTSIKQAQAHVDAQLAEAEAKLIELVAGMTDTEVLSLLEQADQIMDSIFNKENTDLMSMDLFNKASAISNTEFSIMGLRQTKESELMIIDFDLKRLPIPEGYDLVSPAGFHPDRDNVFCLVAQ